MYRRVAGRSRDGELHQKRSGACRSSRMTDLTGFARDLLCVVVELEEATGVEIRQRFDENFEINRSQGSLYETLDRLADAGLVEKRINTPDYRTNTYRSTGDGIQVLVDVHDRAARALSNVEEARV